MIVLVIYFVVCDDHGHITCGSHRPVLRIHVVVLNCLYVIYY